MSVRDKTNGLDPDTVAYREYEYHMPDGTEASVSVSLGDPTQPSPAATFARESGARAHGHITVHGIRGLPSHPILWMHAPSGLKIVIAEDDPKLPDEAERLLVRVLRTFFRDVRHVAPGLAELLPGIAATR